METRGRAGEALGVPLIFHPPRQLAYQRAKNQDAVYLAHMDLRVDLAEVWDEVERTREDERIFVKLILPAHLKPEAAGYLATRGIDRTF
ncbi:MAG: hypothetical protein ACREQ9_01335, partial [Candidatus Binatia bacterium]